MIDLYCERLGPGFWAEPLNAVTNLSFVVAAIVAWRDARRQGVLHLDIVLLTGLVLAIGVGSFLFHTFATRWALAADVIPILLFQVLYLWSYSGRVIGLGPAIRSLAVAGLVAGFYFSARLPEVLNGSLAYLPAFLVLLALALYHRRHAVCGRGLLPVATALLTLSLALRTIDNAVCDQFGVGTHLFWHLLNGLVLLLAMRGLVLNVRTA